MADLREAAQQALEALTASNDLLGTMYLKMDAITALRAALAQGESMCVGCEGKPTLQNSPCAVCGKIAQQEQEPVEIKPPNPEGATQCIVRWFAETPAGWVGAWDREALEQFVRHAEPDPPPEPISDAKIRAEFLDIDRHTLPGETAAEDWFEAGVRYAERQHEIV
jgi:hypothetical protein